jgi:hypothetical protein
MSRSPLGKYGQVVAAIVALSIIGTYLLVLAILPIFTVIPDANVNALDKLAFLAAGAVFGAAATVNGVKEPIESAHSRIDKIENATGIQTHGVYPAEPNGSPVHSGIDTGPPKA